MSASLERAPPSKKRPLLRTQNQMSAPGAHSSKYGNCNLYQSEPKPYAQSRYLNHLINPSFQEVNRLFVLSF